jgi:hypothetical protein
MAAESTYRRIPDPLLTSFVRLRDSSNPLSGPGANIKGALMSIRRSMAAAASILKIAFRVAILQDVDGALTGRRSVPAAPGRSAPTHS